MLALSDEPHGVRAWGKGTHGEESLGAKLNKLATERIVILHDRRIPGGRANIDHIAVAPGGVFVIDAKHYAGQVEKRNLGNIFRADIRLYVGRRDCTKILHGSEDQAEIVRDALAPLGFSDIPTRLRPLLHWRGVGVLRVAVQARVGARHTPKVPLRAAHQGRGCRDGGNPGDGSASRPNAAARVADRGRGAVLERAALDDRDAERLQAARLLEL
ncbi:MAG: NERD domain-containing protein [Actinobacteria bacterium]|nr:NERD domain-containing protein [Actinomycetota bacterium]